jgi:hypothetical protein
LPLFFLIPFFLLLIDCGASAQQTVDHVVTADSEQKVVSGFRTLSVRSKTVYMKNDQMASALKGHPGFVTLGLEIMDEKSPTDLVLQITRPFLTFNWDYSLSEQTGRTLNAGRVSGFDGRVASSRIAEEVIQSLRDEAAQAKQQNEDRGAVPVSGKSASQILSSFKTLYMHSGTVYMKDEDLKVALQERPEFYYWRTEFKTKVSEAEVTLEVNRPLFTFDWTYKLTDRSGSILLSGKVTSWDGRSAASKLAESIADRVRLIRAAPRIQAMAQVANEQGFQERSFKLSNNTGAGEISIGSENLRFRAGSKPIVEIPLSSIIAISYDSESTNTGAADAYWRFWSNFLEGDEGGATLVMLPVMLAGSIVPESKKGTRHNIGIIYQQQNNLARLRFEMHQHHREVLEALHTATGVRWDDLTKVEKEMRKGPEARGMFRSGLLVTNHDILWDTTPLPPGEYRILLLIKGFDNPFSELSAQRHGEAYVLQGSGFDNHPLAKTEVEFGRLDAAFWSTFARQQPPVTLRIRPNSTAVDEFQIGNINFKVVSASPSTK